MNGCTEKSSPRTDSQRAYGSSVGGMVETLKVARSNANGTKHFAPRAKTRTQAGFSSAFSDGFARPLIIERSDGREQSGWQGAVSRHSVARHGGLLEKSRMTSVLRPAVHRDRLKGAEPLRPIVGSYVTWGLGTGRPPQGPRSPCSRRVPIRHERREALVDGDQDVVLVARSGSNQHVWVVRRLLSEILVPHREALATRVADGLAMVLQCDLEADPVKLVGALLVADLVDAEAEIAAIRLRTAAAQPPTRRRPSRSRPPVGFAFERRTVTTTLLPSLRSTSAQCRPVRRGRRQVARTVAHSSTVRPRRVGRVGRGRPAGTPRARAGLR